MASNIDDHVQEFERFKKSIAEIDSVLKDYVYHAQEFLCSRNRLIQALGKLYEDPLNIKGFLGSHVSKFLEHAQEYDNTNCSLQDPHKLVSPLKKASSQTRNAYIESFSKMEAINSLLKNEHKKSLERKISDDLLKFQERRFDSFDDTFVEIVRFENNVSASLIPPSVLSPLIDDAMYMLKVKDTSPSPKLDLELNSILRSPIAIEYFKEYSKTEFFTENLQFWLEVELFKKLDGDQLKDKAQSIFNRYISEEGDRQINIDAPQRNEICKSIDNPTPNMYNSAQASSFILLENSFPRFIESLYYTRMKRRLKPLKNLHEYKRYSEKSKYTASLADKEELIDIAVRTKVIDSFSLELKKVLTTLSQVTCLIEIADEIWIGCGDGRVLSIRVLQNGLSAALESEISIKEDASIVKFLKMNNELLILDSIGQLHAVDLKKRKIYGRLGKPGMPEVLAISKVDEVIWTSTSDKKIHEWVYNKKKRKWKCERSKDVSSEVTCFIKVDNIIWAGDVKGYITKYNRVSMNQSGDKIKISLKALLFFFKSDIYANKDGFQSHVIHIWAGTTSDTMYVIDTSNTSNIIKLPKHHDLPVLAAAKIDRYIALTSEDCRISLWDRESLTFKENLPYLHKDAIGSICVTSDERFIFCGSSDNSLSIWEKIPSEKTTPR